MRIKKKLKRFLTALLCACVLAGVMAPTALAATTLTIINITVAAPSVGQKPATTASVPSHAHSVVQKVEWSGQLDSNGAFIEGVSYKVTVTMGIKPGADWKFSSKSINAKVNTNVADEVLWYSKDKVQVIYTFPALVAGQLTPVSAIHLTVDKPATGNMPAVIASVPDTEPSMVHSVTWSGLFDIDGSFMPRVEYTAIFTMLIKPGTNYYYSDKENSLAATVNGKAADDVLWYSPEVVQVIYTFPAFDTGTIITKAHITMAGPAAGEIPATDAHVPSTASTYVKSILWDGPLDSNGCFQSGVEYTAYLTLGMKDNGRKFSEKSFDAYVNGVLIDEVVRVSDKELIVPIEFEKTP